MKDVFSDPQFRVQSYCRLVTMIRLNVDDMGTFGTGLLLEFFNHCSGDALAAITPIDC